MRRVYTLLIGLAFVVGMVAVPGAFADDHYLSDDDGDSLPWIVEVLLCNNGAIRLAVNTVGGATGAGECSDPENFNGEDVPDPGPIPPDNPADPKAALCSVVNETPELGSCDEENNYSPPPAPGADPNAALCSVVNQSALLGSCDDENNYTPPPAPGADPKAAFCSVVNETPELGSCDEENNYSPPPAPGVDPNAALCSIVNETPELGSCDDENNYSPPPTPGADPNEALCGVVKDHPELGSCDEENNYSPPPAPGVDPKAALCSVVNETPELGSCDDQNNYSPPSTPGGHHQLMCGDEPGGGLENAGTELDGSCEYGEDGPIYKPPGVPGAPEDPPVGPGDFGCGGAESYLELIDQLLTDADCDGWTNEEEISSGCNPLDDRQSPANPSGCQDTGDPPSGHCSGETDPVRLLDAILTDADCDGWTNEEELDRGTNPLLPDG